MIPKLDSETQKRIIDSETMKFYVKYCQCMHAVDV